MCANVFLLRRSGRSPLGCGQYLKTPTSKVASSFFFPHLPALQNTQNPPARRWKQVGGLETFWVRHMTAHLGPGFCSRACGDVDEGGATGGNTHSPIM